MLTNYRKQSHNLAGFYLKETVLMNGNNVRLQQLMTSSKNEKLCHNSTLTVKGTYW